MRIIRPDAYPQDIAYDCETYHNCFTAVFTHIQTGRRWIFEISDRMNQSTELVAFLYFARTCKMRFVGFNNVGFDYPVIHEILNIYAAQGTVYAHQIQAKATTIIHSDSRFTATIWPKDRIVPQLDLYLIHHFDNKAKTTSLKALEINMRSHTVKDLPYDPNVPLEPWQIPILIKYNCHDVDETINFYMFSIEAIRTREELTLRLGEDFTNYNDTKIGKEFFIMELEKKLPGICFDRSTRKKVPRQTLRPAGIPLKDVIFPYVKFQHPELQRVHDYLSTVTIHDTKGAPELKDLHAIVKGFRFDFGTGGIHGSIERRIVRSTKTHVIVDADVTSYYPKLAIENGVFPAHLSKIFCEVYEELFKTRAKYPKKSAENLLYKLALNGVYGDSNNPYSPFLDPQYTMTITVNGQLLICMCAAIIIDECDAEPIQANTDGFTVRIPRDKRARYDEICKWWMDLTKLNLEFAEYDTMCIRDVNNYIAKPMNPEKPVKRVGAYQYVTPYHVDAYKVTPERGWHQDHGGLIIPMAAQAAMLDGVDIETFIRSHTDAFDFMLRVKVPRSSNLFMVEATKVYGPPSGWQTQNICRYYVANTDTSLMKIMPPDKRNPLIPRNIGVEVGWNVKLCNSLDEWDWSLVDYRYYVEEAKKLVLTDDTKVLYQDLFAPLAA